MILRDDWLIVLREGLKSVYTLSAAPLNEVAFKRSIYFAQILKILVWGPNIFDLRYVFSLCRGGRGISCIMHVGYLKVFFEKGRPI